MSWRRRVRAAALVAGLWTCATLSTGCAYMQNQPHTTLDVGAGYAYLQPGFDEDEHHQYGAGGRLHHDAGNGLLTGLHFGFLQGRTRLSGKTVESTYAIGSFGPYFGFDSRYVAGELGLSLFVGGNDRALRLFPLPFLTFRAGNQDSVYFEFVAGPERGVWDGTMAQLNVGARFGDRKEFLFRGGFVIPLRTVVERDFFSPTTFTFHSTDAPPVGAMLELTWTGNDGVGFYARVVGAAEPTAVVGLAFDLRQLTGAAPPPPPPDESAPR